MNEEKILNLCRGLGGTVYETIRMADAKALKLLREFLDELCPVPVKPRLASRCPMALIERAGPILAELKKDPGRHVFYHAHGIPGLNMGQYLAEVIAAIDYSANGAGMVMTAEMEKFSKEAKAVLAQLPC